MGICEVIKGVLGKALLESGAAKVGVCCWLSTPLSSRTPLGREGTVTAGLVGRRG